MKQGWEIKKLGEVATIVGGSTPKTNDFANWGGSNYWVTPAELTGNKWISSTERTITDLGVKNAHLQILPVGTVLLSSRAPIGKVAITAVEMYCNQGFKNIVCSENILNEFVYWFLFHNTDYLNSLGTGATFKEISKRVVEQIPIPVPERAEQERIVGELDCLSGIIAAKRAQLRELDTLAQSIFYTMFGDPITNDKGWQTKRIKDVFNVKIGPFGSLLHNRDYINGGVPLVNPIHMQNEMIYPDFDFTVSDTKLKELENYILHTNDIIFARRGDIGRCAIVRKTEDGYLCGTGSLYIRPASPIDSIFVVKMIRCSSMIEHLVSLAKGATMLNINCKIIEELNIITPPIDLQKQFAEKIENIERQKELITKSIKETEDLFNSRMSYYFD